MSAAPVVDTDMLSEVLKNRNTTVTAHASAYLRSHGVFTFSAITRYESERGLEELADQNRLATFRALCGQCTIIPLSEAIASRAAGIWAELKKNSNLIPDADILIAATALELGVELITGNERHMSRIPGLSVVNWRNP